MPKKKASGSGVASQTPISLYLMGQQRCFWIPLAMVFELDNAKKPLSGFCVPYRPGKVFWVPMMGVFELDNARKYCLGSRLAPQTSIPLYPMGRLFFLDTYDGAVCTAQCQKKRGVLGGASNIRTTYTKCFQIRMTMVFELRNARKYCSGSGVAPQTPIPSPPC